MSLKIKEAVVTGAAGFIGQALVKHLADEGTRVIAVDRLDAKLRDCEFRQLDITKRSALDDLLNEQTVLFHLAANASVEGSVVDPRNDFQENIYSLLEVFESARRKSCRVIFPSTASIFGVIVFSISVLLFLKNSLLVLAYTFFKTVLKSP